MRPVALLAALVVVSAAPAEDWPQWLGPKRNASSTESVKPWTGEPKNLKTLWKMPVGEGHSSPIVAGGKVYLHTKVDNEDTEKLTIFDAVTGEEDRHSSTQPRNAFSSVFGVGPRATPLVTADGQIVTLGVTGKLNVQGKKLNWTDNVLDSNLAPNLRFGVSASPLQDGERLVIMVGGKGAGLVAYNRGADRKVEWKSLDDAASYASPIMIDHGKEKLICALTAEGVVAVQPNDGKEVWRFPFKDTFAESSTTPVQAGDTLIVSSITLGSVALKLTSKDGQPAVEELWKKPALTCYFSTPVVIGDHVYMTTGRLVPPPSMTLHCVELATGKIAWSHPNVGEYHAALLLTGDNKLLLHGDNGDLSLIEPNAKEYRELCKKAKICGKTWAHPALANGKLYVRDLKNLICVQLPE